MEISLPTPAKDEDLGDIQDLELTGCAFCPSDFKWNTVGMPQGLNREEELEFRIKHIDQSLETLSKLEANLQ